MTTAKVIEIIGCSDKSFDDAVKNAVAEAAKTIKGIKALWVKDQSLCIKDNKIDKYKVILKLTFEVNHKSNG